MIIALLLAICISFLLSSPFYRDFHGGIRMIDLGEIYFGSRCALQHKDPYDRTVVLREFRAEGGRFPTNPFAEKVYPIAISVGVNLPTTLFLAIPLAMLPWGTAQYLWIALVSSSFTLAAFLIWDIGGRKTPWVFLSLAGFILMNCEQILALGNIAGIAVSFCIVAVWCFLRRSHIIAGAFLLAVSLVLKPHDAGFVWLYFLLARGARWGRALQSLLVAAALGLLAAIWITPFSPHWLRELHRNVVLVSACGGTSDPGLPGMTSRTIGQIIDLQSVLSVFKDDPHFYNPVSYLIFGPLILAWAFVVIRRRYSPEQAPFALAAISVLTLLPVYHRPYDAKLLMLTIPACAILWTERGVRRWIALALTSAGILITSDIPIALQLLLTRNLSFSTSSLAGKVMTVLLLRPAPLVLLALGCFYLWVYIRCTSLPSGSTPHQYAAEQTADDAAVKVGG